MGFGMLGMLITTLPSSKRCDGSHEKLTLAVDREGIFKRKEPSGLSC
jgi:hypothetical protein